MSALLAVVATVAATPVPVPTPEVIVKTVQAAPLVPDNVLQLGQVLALAAAGGLTSIVHLALERGKLPGNINRLLFTLYSAVAGIVVVVLAGKLQWNTTSVVTGLTAALAFLGSTQGQKFILDFASKLMNSTKVDPTGVVVPDLATDETVAPA